MRLLYLFIFIIASSILKAQSNTAIITYYDKDWQPVKKANDAVYCRKVETLKDKYLVKDFYKATDTLQMEAVCSKVTPTLVQEGLATFYHKNGQIERTGLYAQGLPVGVHKSYYINGNPRSVNVYREKDVLVAQYWSATGAPLLVNGTGLISETSEYVHGTVYMELKDSIQLCAFNVNQGDTIYTTTQTPAEYRGGLEAFYRGLSKSLKYPDAARRNGVEGRVFIKFIVNERGAPVNAEVIKGIGSGCDAEALVACLKQKEWEPGRYKNKPVKMVMVLPVTFRLR
jgi:TonB family protein